MNRDQLKALIVETLATTTTPARTSDTPGNGSNWGTKPWHRHKVEDGDGGHNFVGSCALCRQDIHGLAQALTDAIENAPPVVDIRFDGRTAEKARELTHELRKMLAIIEGPLAD